MITRDEIVTWAESMGWTRDKYGHLKQTYNDNLYRLRFEADRLRYEVRMKRAYSLNTCQWEWKRISSARYKDLSIIGGRLIGFKIKV